MACSDFKPRCRTIAAQRLGLIVGTERRKFAAGLRRGTLAAAAEIVDAEHPVLAGIDAEPRPDHLRPPALARRTATMRCAEMPPRTATTGASLGTHEAEGDARIGQRIAVVQARTARAAATYVVDLDVTEFSGHVPLQLLKGLHNPWSASARSPLKSRECRAIDRLSTGIERIARLRRSWHRSDRFQRDPAVVAPASKGLSLSRSR